VVNQYLLLGVFKVSYQTEEQQVEDLKEWWKDNGTPLIVGAVLGLSGFAGWKYWNEEQIITETKASDSFLTVTKALGEDKLEDVSNASQTVKANFPDSSYAILSAFQLAKRAVDDNNLDKAVMELEWVLSNHGSNDLASIAKIRIARVLISQNEAEKALSYLNFTKDSGYAEMANLVKGDALLSLGKNTEALEAYQAASNAGKLTANHPTLKIKIASLQTPAFDLEETEVAVPDSTADSTIDQVVNETEENETGASSPEKKDGESK
jgi:predicted negative regulator of RcsB-dependent stress response